VIVDAAQIVSLRAGGRSWAHITDETGVSKGTARRAVSFMKVASVAVTSDPEEPGFAG